MATPTLPSFVLATISRLTTVDALSPATRITRRQVGFPGRCRFRGPVIDPQVCSLAEEVVDILEPEGADIEDLHDGSRRSKVSSPAGETIR